MPKCKVCEYRLSEGVTKCPMCGATAGSTIAGEISPELNLPKYFCPSCNSQILGEHRYCPSCGIDLKEAAKKAENLKTQKQEITEEKKCVNCGAVLTPNAKFCPECGAKQEVIPVEQASKEPAISKKLKTESKNKQKQGPLTTSGGLVNGQPETPMEAFEYYIEDGEYILSGIKDEYKSLTEIVIPNSFSRIYKPSTHEDLSNCFSGQISGEEFSPFSNCKKLKTVVIPNTVKEIGNLAFARCKSLRNIIFPNCLEKIGEFAFFWCENLKSIIIPDSVKEIGCSAFYGCTNLMDVVLSKSVSILNLAVFTGCKNLKHIEIPCSVTEIGLAAFEKCESLSQLNIPNSVRKIRIGAFRDCESLKKVIIPKSVIDLEEAVFKNCIELTEVEILNDSISVEEINKKEIFLGCPYIKSLIIGNKSIPIKKLKLEKSFFEKLKESF